MRKILAAGIVGLIGACSPSSEAINVCEGELMKTLRSPSTYQRVEAVASAPWEDSKFWKVSISYDADNAFGTPVRGSYFCAFKAMPDGALPSRSAMEAAAMTSRIDGIEASIEGKAEVSAAEALYPCCLSRDDKKAFIASGLQ
jgi:hypothetical protein